MYTDFVKRIESRIPATQVEEYTGDDGLKHCKRCAGPTQCRVTLFGVEQVVRCLCPCEKQRLADIEAQEMQLQQIERRRRDCFDVATMRDWTFAADDRKNPKVSDAMGKYACRFDEFLAKKSGLLLFGPCGTGKSFYAAAIANKVIEMGFTAKMTNFATIINRLQSTFEGKDSYIEGLNRYQLLVIDDLGAERTTSYMQELVYTIVDSRYRSGLPMIITTNLTREQIKHSGSVENERIYDRIMERCLPVEVAGQSRRKQKLRETADDMRNSLGL